MSWFRLALGLMREAASTQVGQDIIHDLKESAFKTRHQDLNQLQNIDQVRTFLEERMTVVDRNMELLVQMFNAQDKALIKIQQNQRVWNLVLVSGVLVAIAVAILL